MTLGTVAVVVILTTLLLGAGAVQAQGPMGMGGFGWSDHSLIAVAADVLGMEEAELITLLQNGKTIAQVAEEKGVDVAKIVDAFVAEHQEMLNTAVTSGRMTQEQADLMVANMTTHVALRLSQPFTGYGISMGSMNGGHGMCGMSSMNMPGGGMMGGMRGGHWVGNIKANKIAEGEGNFALLLLCTWIKAYGTTYFVDDKQIVRLARSSLEQSFHPRISHVFLTGFTETIQTPNSKGTELS